MNVIFDSGLKDQFVRVRCTWAAAYAEPKVNKGLRVISYNKSKGFPRIIGYLTGNYVLDEKAVFWVEALPEQCNRMDKVWFRANDILPDLKISIPATPEPEPKKNNWLWWLTAGLMVLKNL